MKLSAYRLRFRFAARESVYFPAGKSTNILRGAFGSIFRRIACLPECREPATCPLEGSCPYEQIFAPIARQQGPSGFRDLPRPLVFRGAHLDGRTVSPGECFAFDVNLFRTDTETVAFLTLAFAQLATEGVGPRRGRASLLEGNTLSAEGAQEYCFFSDGIFRQSGFPDPISYSLPDGNGDLVASPDNEHPLVVHFVTPTELKHEGRIAERPEAPILFARIFDRISALAHFYGDQAAPHDNWRQAREHVLRAASAVRLTRSDLRMESAARSSSRTGQRHALEGFVGEAEYVGPADAMATLLPWLHVAAVTGIGRQTVWGKGEIQGFAN